MRTEVARRRSYLLITLTCLGGSATLVGILVSSQERAPNTWALVLILLNAGLAVFPFWHQARRGVFDLWHPMAYASFIAIMPMVVVKGLWVVLGARYSGGLSLTPDPGYYFALALLYSLLGYSLLMAGFYSSIGFRIGSRLRRLGASNWRLEHVFAPATVIFFLGTAVTLWLASTGAYIYGLYEGDLTVLNVLQRLGDWRYMALFMLVFAIVRVQSKRPTWVILLLVSSTIVLALDFSAGGRSRMFSTVLLMAAAYQYARYPSVRVKALVLWLLLALLVLLVGVVFATAFRFERLRYGPFDRPTTLTDMAYLVSGSASTIMNMNTGEVVDFIEDIVFERLESLDNLGLTLAYSHQLEAAERAVGIDNNIIKSILWSFVPRFLWPSKPIVSNFGLWFYRLYYGTSGWSWRGPTAIGDLYRNFGTPGVLAGMFLLGIVLRVLYSWLIEGRAPALPEALLYYFLSTRIGYESSYATFFVDGLRTAVMVLAIALVMNWSMKMYAGSSRYYYGRVRSASILERPTER